MVKGTKENDEGEAIKSITYIIKNPLAQTRHFLYFVNGSGLGGVRAARPQRHLTGGTLAQTSLENIAEEDLLDRRRRKGNSVERGLSERKIV